MISNKPLFLAMIVFFSFLVLFIGLMIVGMTMYVQGITTTENMTVALNATDTGVIP